MIYRSRVYSSIKLSSSLYRSPAERSLLYFTLSSCGTIRNSYSSSSSIIPSSCTRYRSYRSVLSSVQNNTFRGTVQLRNDSSRSAYSTLFYSPNPRLMLRRFFGYSSSSTTPKASSISAASTKMDDKDTSSSPTNDGGKDILLPRFKDTPNVPQIQGYEPIGYLHQLPSLAHYISSTGDDICVAILPPSSFAASSASSSTSSSIPYPRVHAVGNLCPHKQASMHLGDIEDMGTQFNGDSSIICPRHRKKYPKGLHFDLCNGKSFLYEPPLAKYDKNWCLPVYSIILLHENEATTENVAHALVYVSSEPQSIDDKETVKLMKKLKQDNQTVKVQGTTISNIVVSSEQPQQQESSSNNGSTKVAAVAGITLLTASNSSSSDDTMETEDRQQTTTKETVVQSTSSTVSMTVTNTDPSVENLWIPFTINSVKQESPDTNIYYLEYIDNRNEFTVSSSISKRLQQSKQSCNPFSWHVSMCLQPASLSREYTPVSSFTDFVDGTIDPASNRVIHKLNLLIKIYPQGKLTKQLVPYTKGNLLYISLPETTIMLPQMVTMDTFIRHPQLQLSPPSLHVPSLSSSSSLLFVCGGTGITPILQLLEYCIQQRILHPLPNNIVTDIYVVISNHTVNDILCRSMVTALLSSSSAASPVRIRIVYTCTKANNPIVTLSPEETKINQQNINAIRFTTGRIDKEMMVSVLEPLLVLSDSTDGATTNNHTGLQRVVISGPRGMYETIHDIVVSITAVQNKPIINHSYDIVELEA